MNMMRKLGTAKRLARAGDIDGIGKAVGRNWAGTPRWKKRTAIAGGAMIGANAAFGPNGNRSTARNGIRPRSTGGYA